MKLTTIPVAAAMLILLVSGACAFTMTFDDIEPGYRGLMDYADRYAIWFDGFYVADHTASPWGPPHSGSQVLITKRTDWVEFHSKDQYQLYYASSVSGYFSTQMDTVIRMDCYSDVLAQYPIGSVYIGALGESWSNRYVEITSSGQPIFTVIFRPVTPERALLGFSIDDLTYVPFPEPASLLTLAAGIAGMAMWRRRR